MRVNLLPTVIFLDRLNLMMMGDDFFSEDKTQSALCDASEIGRASCGRNQRCRMINEGASICECLRDFHFVDNECVRVAPTTATIDAINLKPDLISESGGTKAKDQYEFVSKANCLSSKCFIFNILLDSLE
jgi:hypothetical protein